MTNIQTPTLAPLMTMTDQAYPAAVAPQLRAELDAQRAARADLARQLLRTQELLQTALLSSADEP